MQNFSDYFSDQAEDYATCRPRYPSALFAFLADQVPEHQLAWDAGTGSGQAAIGLTKYFDSVLATDVSQRQLTAAVRHSRITYRRALAEQSGLPDGSVDLATAAQALHWFDRPAYFAEAARVVRPGGLIAVWGYGWLRIGPEVDSVLSVFRGRIDAWWSPERRLVERAYQDVVLPYPDLPTPDLLLREEWDLTHLVGYIRTWSAVRRWRSAAGVDPTATVDGDLRAVWGDPKAKRLVSWPVFLRTCRVPGGTRRPTLTA